MPPRTSGTHTAALEASHKLRPFARFSTVFAWGLSRVLRTKKFQVTLVLAALAGFGLGRALASERNTVQELWEFINNGILGAAVPLIALALVAGGFAEEVQDQTLVWHLVRPVSRTTLFIARYAAGVVAAVICASAITLLAVWASGTDLPWNVYFAALCAALLGTVTVGSLYYALAALFRRGLVAGLVYTFVVEFFFQNLPGSVQVLGLTHHVRSVFHQLADADFAQASSGVRRAIEDAKQPSFDPQTLRLIAQEPWSSVSGALLVCAAVTVGSLAIGAYRVGRRDFALKD